MQLDYSLRFDGRGRTASTDEGEHIPGRYAKAFQ